MVLSCCPLLKWSSFDKYLEEVAAAKLAWLKNQIAAVEKVYLGCDKGNKKGIEHFIKYVSWWDADLKKIQSYLLDSEAAGGKDKDCADAIDHSLKRLDGDSHRTKLHGQNTDAGGGGVGEGLTKELYKKQRVANPSTYLTTTCSLHTSQLLLSNPLNKLLAPQGLGKHTALQCLHSCFNLCTGGGGTFKIQEFKDMWFRQFREKFEQITQPVLTR